MADVVEAFGIESIGAHGSTLAIALLMDAVKKGGDRQELHEKIKVHSMEAAKVVKIDGGKNDLLERIAADSAFPLTMEELLEVMNPINFVGMSVKQVENFIENDVNVILNANNISDEMTEIRV